MPKLDRVNLRLIDLLQEDARHSYVDLADAIDRAESTVRERVARLEEDGVLAGYGAEVDHRRVGLPVEATVRADGDRDRWSEITRRLTSVPFVERAWVTTAARPLRVRVRARSLDQLDGIVEHELAGLDLGRMEVAIHMRDLVPRRSIPLQEIHEEPQLPIERSRALGLTSTSDGRRNGKPTTDGRRGR